MLGEKITIIIPVRNEAARLPLVLRNFSKMAHVLVVDNHSTDNSREITKEFGRTSIELANVGGFVENSEWMDAVWAQIQTPYMLLAACAEYVPPALLSRYDQIANTSSHDVVLAKRLSITDGLPIPIDLPPRWLNLKYKGEVRFYRRGAVDYTNNHVHGRGRTTCQEGRVLVLPQKLDLMFYQYRDYDSSESESKHRVYNDVWAAQKVALGEPYKCLFFKEIVRAFKKFIDCYFIYGGFRYGVKGLIHSYYRFHLHVGLAFRFYECSIGALKPDIQRKHMNLRDALLKSNGL